MKSKIALIGSPSNKIKILLEECTNNNQISYHVRKNEDILNFLKEKTQLVIDNPMILLYHYKEGIKDIPKCICGANKKYHCYGYRETCGKKKCVNIIREESKKTFCLDNYGVEYVTQLESMKERSKKNIIE